MVRNDRRQTELGRMIRHPLKLAVFFDQTISVAGGYQQAINALLLIRELPPRLCNSVVITTISQNIKVLREYGVEARYLPMPIWRRCALRARRLLRGATSIKLVRKCFGANALERFLEKIGVDLVYFTSPSGLAQSLERLNYIFTVWDLCHRDDVEFPEIRNDREFERREQLYTNTLTKAVAVLVDSELGKTNLANRYGVDLDRICVIPFSPSIAVELTEEEYIRRFVDIKTKYSLNMDYIFYPAQFWPHKNHVYILEGLKLLEENHGIILGAIFSGADTGNLEFVTKMTKQLDLVERVRFPGFVPNDDLPYLYRQSTALVMPTFFGPTNLPPLEAFRLGVPVLYSDKLGLREQVEGAALLMDLDDPSTMAEQLAKLYLDIDLRNELARVGAERLSVDTVNGRLQNMTRILNNFRLKRSCWGH